MAPTEATRLPMLFTLAVFPTIKHQPVNPRMGEIGIVRVSDLAHVQPIKALKPVESQEIATVAEIPVPEPPKAPEPAPPVSIPSSVNLYTWGNCTYGVASWINVPQDLGNANQWAYNASREGFTVSSVPRVGSVAQTNAGYYGHVALVIGVTDSTVVVREMNYTALGVTSEREAPISEFIYIYF